LDKKLYVSSDVRSDEAGNFLDMTAGLDMICNAITALIGPQQYDAGLAAVQLVKAGSHLQNTHPNVDRWMSVWSGFSVIVTGSLGSIVGAAPMDYDLLVSGGTHQECVLDVHKTWCQDLGWWREGLQAHFMKDAVHDRLGQSTEWGFVMMTTSI